MKICAVDAKTDEKNEGFKDNNFFTPHVMDATSFLTVFLTSN